jgi:uncharacterized phage-associated protein
MPIRQCAIQELAERDGVTTVREVVRPRRIIEHMSEKRPTARHSQGLLPEPYPGRMTSSAHDIAAALRERLPGLPKKKLHKLLYYCQGHHLATFGKPLFRETVSAWDMGPVVGTLWYEERGGTVPAVRGEISEAELNTVGYVVSRYGALTGRDLEHLTHSEDPWRRADRERVPGQSRRIEVEWIKDYFAESGAADEDEDIVLDSMAVKRWLSDADERLDEPVHPDSPERLQARLAQLMPSEAQ